MPLADDLMVGEPPVLQQMVPQHARHGAGRAGCAARAHAPLRAQPRGAGGEIQLTDGIAGLMGQEKVHAYRYRGTRYDCGSKEGYVQATMELALRDAGLASAVRGVLER